MAQREEAPTRPDDMKSLALAGHRTMAGASFMPQGGRITCLTRVQTDHFMSSDRTSVGVIALRETFSQCRHGIALRDVSAQQGADGWVIWGHYSCQQCNKVALHVSGEVPRAVNVDGRMMPVILN